MKKNLITIALAVGCMSPAFAEEMTVEVGNATELSAALEQYATRSDVTIKLTGDCIYGASLDVTKHFDKFCGTLEGGYTKLDDKGNVIQEDGEDAIFPYTIKGLREPLFGKMEGAKLRYLRFEDCSDPKSSKWFSHESYIFCENATGCEFSNILIQDCHYYNEWSSGTLGNFSNNLGLMVGYMKDCQVEYVNVMSSSLYCVAVDVGCIAGEAEGCTFISCHTDALSSVYSNVEPNAYVGGLVGNSNECHFIHCSNAAVVGAQDKADNVGGLTGISYLSDFTDCENSGILTQTSGAQFSTYQVEVEKFATNVVMGYSFKVVNYWLQVRKDALHDTWFKPTSDQLMQYNIKCAKATAIALVAFAIQVAMEVYEASDPDEMGGMSGAAYGCTYEQCENRGMVFCRDAFSGGIVGYASNKSSRSTVIRNCINNGYVQGNEQVGGIVGKLDNSQVYNCINTGTVDAEEDTFGPIYGERDNDSDSPVQNCFVMTHDAEYTPGVPGGEEMYNVSLMDVKSGLAAAEMNRLLGEGVFRQFIGEEPYPTFCSTAKVVTAGDIRNDVDLVYHVKDLDEFSLALFNQYADIVLDADIDFKESYFSLYRKNIPFHGSIDGQGYAIKHLKVDTGDADDGISKWDWLDGKRARFGFIGAAEGAVFKNFSLSDFSIKLPDNVGGLVCESTNCTYENVHLAGNSYIGALDGIGGMVFKSEGDHFIGCTAGDSVTVEATDLSYFDYDSNAAALASKASGSTFTDCVNNGDVWARTDGAGGIVADCDNCTFTRCINNGHVAHSSETLNNDDEVGGIAATAEDCEFYQCVNNGRITCHDEYGGGIVGRGVSCTLNNCLNTVTTLGYMGMDFNSSTCGGIIGEAKYCLITNCCSATDLPLIGNTSIFGNDNNSGNNFRVLENNDNTTNYVKTLTRQEMQSGLVAKYLNDYNIGGETPWRQNLTAHDGMTVDACPVLDPTHDLVTVESRTLGTAISTPEELMAFAKRVNEGDKDQFASAHLTADIDMAGYDWTPIGSSNSFSQYRGAFDGRGHTISGLKCTSSAEAGLFGAVHVGAEIRNVIIGKDCEFTCTGNYNEGVAGIVGKVDIGWDWGYVRIENCANYGKVIAPSTANAGGILGLVNNSTSDNVKVYVSNCYNMGDIFADNQNGALLCGYLKNSGVVSNCWSGGLLLSSTSMKPYEPTHDEYFAGYDTRIDIQNCYSIDAEHNVQGATWQTSQAGVLDLYQSHVLEGQLTYRLNGNTNDVSQSLTWQQKLGVDALPEWGSKGVYHTRTVSESSFGENSYGYGTLCLPYDVKSDEDIHYYTFSEATGSNGDVKLNFAYAEVVPAGTPVLFRVQNAGEYSFYGADAGVNGWAYSPYSSQTDTWKLRGTFADTSFGGDDAKSIYYVAGGEIRNATSVSIAPYRAYFTGPNIEDLLSDNTLARVRIVIDGVEDETTALQLVAGDVVAGQSAKSYTLFGTEASESYRGLTIRNGQKVLVR